MNSIPTREEIEDVMDAAEEVKLSMWTWLVKMDNELKILEKKYPNAQPLPEMREWHNTLIIKGWDLEEAVNTWPRSHGITTDRLMNYQLEGDELLRSLPRIVKDDSDLSSEEDEFNLLQRLASHKIFE